VTIKKSGFNSLRKTVAPTEYQLSPIRQFLPEHRRRFLLSGKNENSYCLISRDFLQLDGEISHPHLDHPYNLKASLHKRLTVESIVSPVLYVNICLTFYRCPIKFQQVLKTSFTVLKKDLI